MIDNWGFLEAIHWLSVESQISLIALFAEPYLLGAGNFSKKNYGTKPVCFLDNQFETILTILGKEKMAHTLMILLIENTKLLIGWD